MSWQVLQVKVPESDKGKFSGTLTLLGMISVGCIYPSLKSVVWHVAHIAVTEEPFCVLF